MKDAKSKKKSKVGIVFTIGIIILAIVILLTGSINVKYNENDFTVSASFWKSSTYKYEEIEEIKLLDSYDKGSRTVGVGSLRLNVGAFRSDDFGNYTLYSYSGSESGVYLKINGNTVVISCENNESTKEVYKELKDRME